MTTKPSNTEILWSRVELTLFILGFVIATIPIFSMDYLVTLDGPNHLYSSNIFYELLDSKSFYSKYIEFNDGFTPNYFTVFILGGLQTLFSGVTSLKIFHILHLVLLFGGAMYWANSDSKNKIVYPFLVLPFAYSYLFFSGFYNFIFAVSIAFWCLGFYERTNAKEWRLKHFLILGIFLFTTFITHVIPFFFVGLYLFVHLFLQWMASNWSKQLLKKSLFIFLCSSPGLILTVLFMGSRSSEYEWLETSELISRLTSGFSIVIKSASAESTTMTNWFKLIFLAFGLMLFAYQFSLKNRKKNWSILITVLATLTFYFILPDSAGYASVFSVRIEYILWLFILIGATRATTHNKKLSIASGVVGITLLIFQINTNLPYWKTLNGHSKSIIAATEYIEENSVVYPVFNSLIWDDYHISNFMGTTGKDIMILENTSARQDYFPVIYKEPYEDCLSESQSNDYQCGEQYVHIDYLLIVGKIKLDPNNALAIKLYSSAYNEGTIVYEDDFVQLLKFPTHQN